MDISKNIEATSKEIEFSGVISVKAGEETHIATEDDGEYYGYGIWIRKKNDAIFKYHLMGHDPGVSFNSAVYPAKRLRTVITSNKCMGPYHITRAIEKEL
ncbi:hypothetical protein ACSS6N_11805 [Peribacillus frigoritolerans]|uniref:hypothetical protein n=1 Tax=Peribacillus frigoritolerans TaxID=450367 RepID=UPI003F851292